MRTYQITFTLVVTPDVNDAPSNRIEEIVSEQIPYLLEGLQLSTGASWELNCESRDIQIEPI